MALEFLSLSRSQICQDSEGCPGHLRSVYDVHEQDSNEEGALQSGGEIVSRTIYGHPVGTTRREARGWLLLSGGSQET